MQDLVDTHIFESAREVVEGLRRRDCGPALIWCEDNKARLKKIKSKLEFKLRLQVHLLFVTTFMTGLSMHWCG